MPLHFRVYPNLDRTQPKLIPDAEIEQVVAYNRRYRPGGAQFVNGKCVYRGYLSIEKVKAIDPTVTDAIDGVNVDQAVAILKSDTEVPMPPSETETGGMKIARALFKISS